MYRRITTLLACWLVTAAIAVPARAQQPKLEPLVVVAGNSYDQLTQDLAYLGVTINNERFPELVGRMLQAVTGVRQLEGLDTRRRFGAAISSDGVIVAPVAFVPVNDLAALLRALEPRIGAAVKDAKGFYTLGQGSKTLVAVQDGDWAFFAQSRDALAHRPKPAELLAGISESYDLAVQLNVQKIPEVFRSLAIDQLRLALRDSRQAAPNESAQAFAERKQRMSVQFGLLEQLFAQTEQLTLGWSLDRETKRMQLDLVVQPIKSSQLARRIHGASNAKSTFAGLIDPNSPLSAHITQQLDEQQIAGALAQVSAYRAAALERYTPDGQEDAHCDQCREWINQLFDTAERTIKAGQLDLAVRLTGDRTPWTLVAAARIADGNALRERLENWSEQANDSGGSAKLQLNVAEIPGAEVHAMNLPAGRNIPAERWFGADPKLHVAITADAIWFGIGAQAASAMQQAAAASPNATVPAQASLKLGSIVTLVAQSAGNSPAQGMLSLAGLNLRASDDRLVLQAESKDGALHVRLEAHEGIVRTAALAAMLALAESPNK